AGGPVCRAGLLPRPTAARRDRAGVEPVRPWRLDRRRRDGVPHLALAVAALCPRSSEPAAHRFPVGPDPDLCGAGIGAAASGFIDEARSRRRVDQEQTRRGRTLTAGAVRLAPGGRSPDLPSMSRVAGDGAAEFVKPPVTT